MASEGGSSGDDSLIGIWQYALDRIDKQVEIELNLVNARMSWLVISESFLFNAFVGAGSDSIRPPGAGLAIQVAMGLIGFLIAKYVNSSVRAALRVIDERKGQREPMEARLLTLLRAKARDDRVDLPSDPLNSKWHRDGTTAPEEIPGLLMRGWMALAVVWVCRVLWLLMTKRLMPG